MIRLPARTAWTAMTEGCGPMSTLSMDIERVRPKTLAGPWLQKLVATDADATTTVMRLTLGAVMFPHGAQKVLGWFGGYGPTGTMGFLTEGMGLPWLIAALVLVFEFGGSIALLTGAAGRLGALAIATVMLGAVVTTHLQHGFFMDWAGTQGGEGFEYHLLALALSAAILVRGSGAVSVDRWAWKRLRPARG